MKLSLIKTKIHNIQGNEVMLDFNIGTLRFRNQRTQVSS